MAITALWRAWGICPLVASILMLAFLCQPAQAQTRTEPLADKVRKSIGRGIEFLRKTQRGEGSWEIDGKVTIKTPGGESALALLALLNCGVPPEDPTVVRGLKYLRGLEPDTTYVRALQTMVLAEANRPDLDKEKIQGNVNWLLAGRIYNKQNMLVGWSYTQKSDADIPYDNSNAQYALLGLWAGQRAGAQIDATIWQEIREFYTRTQHQDGRDDGSWNYASFNRTDRTLTMATAGLCGLLIAGMELNAGREKIMPDGSTTNCGVYDASPAVNRALGWISKNFEFEVKHRTFYNLYGIERTGRLTGLRFLGRHDWYREGCQLLVTQHHPERAQNGQRPDGSWEGPGTWDVWPVVSTSFALLFLSKGRTPVLISKLVHTEAWPRSDQDTDWNNDRNDLRNLVDFASKQLFKRTPLAWQNFDILRAAVAKAGQISLSEEEVLDVTSDLLQSPIVYFNGHKSPLRRFRPTEKELLRKYIDNGGFLFVEACCSSPDFDKGFRALAEELWPDNPLVELDASHPVWSSYFPVRPGEPFKLWGVKMSCKTMLIYSPQDLSCQWESNNFQTGRGELAFRLGANVIAYATGMEPPRPRLTQVELTSGKDDDPRKIPRGYLKVAQLKHPGDWQPAPRAMRNLMDHLHKNAGLDVVLKTEELPIASKSVIDFKFLYMHGRNEFSVPTEELKNLRFNLETGGLLFADACCGKPAFDKSFRKFALELFPDRKMQDVPLDDPLFGEKLNGVSLNGENIKCRREIGKEMRSMPPALEGIKIDNRWVLLYSKYDIGCALERHKASDCLGYDTDSAFKIAGAAVLYLLKLQ